MFCERFNLIAYDTLVFLVYSTYVFFDDGFWASPVAETVRNLPIVQETRV